MQIFLLDLDFVSRARSGFVGDLGQTRQFGRSSTQLLLELIEFDRKAEVRDKEGIAAARSMKALDTCFRSRYDWYDCCILVTIV